jgi:hypothetical protein
LVSDDRCEQALQTRNTAEIEEGYEHRDETR